MFQTFPSFGTPPVRLSGVVYGTLMNDPASLAALGDAVHRPPYKAPPKAPVLYLKPRNTLAASGAVVGVPADVAAFEIGASFGLVIGRSACAVSVDDALQFLAGVVLVADLSVPHDSFYRPSVRFRARDGSCLIGPQLLAGPVDPAAMRLRVFIDGELVHSAGPAGFVRGAARLLADVTEFMTLRPGDILMLGVAAGAPQARAGQRFAIEADGLDRLEGALA
jgi:5-oxopent-3-ene-1,2,5-tricarboxylate decarboxylase/2-hydroxyhepta-2,4-diene-1,7-dioate isomerase